MHMVIVYAIFSGYNNNVWSQDIINIIEISMSDNKKNESQDFAYQKWYINIKKKYFLPSKYVLCLRMTLIHHI